MKLAGKKYAGSHSTVIDAAVDLVRFAERLEEVNKISLGIIRKCGATRGGKQIKIKKIPAGLEIVVRGNRFVQTIYLYSDDNNKLNQILAAKFEIIS